MRKALDDGLGLLGGGIQKYPAGNKVKFTMSRTQSKISRHTEKPKNMTHKKENNQSKLIQTDTDIRVSREGP